MVRFLVFLDVRNVKHTGNTYWPAQSVIVTASRLHKTLSDDTPVHGCSNAIQFPQESGVRGGVLGFECLPEYTAGRYSAKRVVPYSFRRKAAFAEAFWDWSA